MKTYKMREAFTMIELIFVIVIIALLAGIAIPKFAATRNDAKVSAKAQNIMVAANEIASYAVSKGSTASDFKVMSASIEIMVEREEATLEAYKAKIKMDNSEDCIIIKIDDNGTNTEVLKIEFGSTTNGNCDQLRSLIDVAAFPIPLRGQLVSY